MAAKAHDTFPIDKPKSQADVLRFAAGLEQAVGAYLRRPDPAERAALIACLQ